jgi:hypothetical protein
MTGSKIIGIGKKSMTGGVTVNVMPSKSIDGVSSATAQVTKRLNMIIPTHSNDKKYLFISGTFL